MAFDIKDGVAVLQVSAGSARLLAERLNSLLKEESERDGRVEVVDGPRIVARGERLEAFVTVNRVGRGQMISW
ncbi:MAG TPA: hypothetical protein DIU42_03130 [Dermacoccus sp.]|nr:hypothetical protein [Dermacoccus sp.]